MVAVSQYHLVSTALAPWISKAMFLVPKQFATTLSQPKSLWAIDEKVQEGDPRELGLDRRCKYSSILTQAQRDESIIAMQTVIMSTSRFESAWKIPCSWWQWFRIATMATREWKFLPFSSGKMCRAWYEVTDSRNALVDYWSSHTSVSPWTLGKTAHWQLLAYEGSALSTMSSDRQFHTMLSCWICKN